MKKKLENIETFFKTSLRGIFSSKLFKQDFCHQFMREKLINPVIFVELFVIFSKMLRFKDNNIIWNSKVVLIDQQNNNYVNCLNLWFLELWSKFKKISICSQIMKSRYLLNSFYID